MHIGGASVEQDLSVPGFCATEDSGVESSSLQ